MGFRSAGRVSGEHTGYPLWMRCSCALCVVLEPRPAVHPARDGGHDERRGADEQHDKRGDVDRMGHRHPNARATSCASTDTSSEHLAGVKTARLLLPAHQAARQTIQAAKQRASAIRRSCQRQGSVPNSTNAAKARRSRATNANVVSFLHSSGFQSAPTMMYDVCTAAVNRLTNSGAPEPVRIRTG